MTASKRVLGACLGVLFCSLAAAEDLVSQTQTASTEPEVTPLRTLSTATAALSADGFLSCLGPPLCDRRQNVYFLVVPHWTPRKDGTAGAGAALRPRDVLRVSADGKKQTTFNPAGIPKFANATELLTIAAALDQHGTLYTLVWARWRDGNSQTEKSGQFILSFKEDGQYRSHLEVDGDQILVDQFEVFGSGDFLLRGRRAQTSEPRLAIFAAAGQTLQDVRRWSGKFLDELSPGKRLTSTTWCAAAMAVSTSLKRIQAKRETSCMPSRHRVTPSVFSSYRGYGRTHRS